jgi:hypothetical protein
MDIEILSHIISFWRNGFKKPQAVKSHAAGTGVLAAKFGYPYGSP